jgi:hypothetical protein
LLQVAHFSFASENVRPRDFFDVPAFRSQRPQGMRVSVNSCIQITHSYGNDPFFMWKFKINYFSLFKYFWVGALDDNALENQLNRIEMDQVSKI